MIREFKNLTAGETELILKAPVLVSLYAASWDHDISKIEKADAVRLAHFKTFTAKPQLKPYYKEVNERFKHYFEEAIRQYAPFDEASRNKMKEEINTVNSVMGKLDKDFAMDLNESLGKYAAHVKKAGRGNVINFIFPLPIPGIND